MTVFAVLVEIALPLNVSVFIGTPLVMQLVCSTVSSIPSLSSSISNRSPKPSLSVSVHPFIVELVALV